MDRRSKLDKKEQLILELWACGAIQFAPWYRHGFKFKFHQTHPRAPRAPMKFQIRTPEVLTYGGGALSEHLLDLVVELMCDEVDATRLLIDAIAGIPNAGVPIARKASRRLGVRCVPMKKEGSGDKRHISHIDPPIHPARVLGLFDDVISHGGSKLEAVQLSNDADWTVWALVVLIDWQLGGLEFMKNNGLRVLTVTNVVEVLDILRRHCLITRRQHRRVLNYLTADRLYRADLAA
ncbi:MAG TPA: hypothetical protein VLF41_01815 [Candidatus Nanoarchaeia archaeon]|nr:hypothetical protein [Candidatus Nanoarchaeia archaeon]